MDLGRTHSWWFLLNQCMAVGGDLYVVSCGGVVGAGDDEVH